LFFCLAVAVAVVSVSVFFAVVTSVSVFFAVSLNMHSKNQVAAVKEGFDFSDMMNEITKMTNQQKKKKKRQTDNTDAG
jgi:uncharacterized metal-binding protein